MNFARLTAVGARAPAGSPVTSKKPALKTALFLFAAAVSFAQTVAVEGRVVDAATGEGVRRAAVSVRRAGQLLTTETNANGAFRVDGLFPGECTISVSRTGYLLSGPREFEIGGGGTIPAIVVSLTPLAVIAGRVVDPDGDPISGAAVTALQYAYANGKRQLRVVRVGASDDRGLYRLFDLAPGRYYVQAVRRGSSGAPLTGYHPSATDPAGAAPIDAAAGVEARGVDVVLRTSGVYTIRARVTNAADTTLRPPDRPAAMLMASLSLRAAPHLGVPRNWSFRQRGNVLEAAEVPPGSYTITVRQIDTRTPGAPQLAAKRNFEVVGSDVEFDVTLSAPFSVSGTLSGISDPTQAPVRLDTPDTGDRLMTAVGGKPGADGRFVLRNVASDTYFVRVTAPEGYYLQSLRLGDRTLPSQQADLTAGPQPLALALAADGAEIAGLVLEGEDRPAAGATVALEPLAPDWPDRMKTLRADANGNFRFHDVAPGEYRVLAWTGEEPDESAAVQLRATADGEHRITVRVRRPMRE